MESSVSKKSNSSSVKLDKTLSIQTIKSKASPTHCPFTRGCHLCFLDYETHNPSLLHCHLVKRFWKEKKTIWFHSCFPLGSRKEKNNCIFKEKERSYRNMESYPIYLVMTRCKCTFFNAFDFIITNSRNLL